MSIHKLNMMSLLILGWHNNVLWGIEISKFRIRITFTIGSRGLGSWYAGLLLFVGDSLNFWVVGCRSWVCLEVELFLGPSLFHWREVQGLSLRRFHLFLGMTCRGEKRWDWPRRRMAVFPEWNSRGYIGEISREITYWEWTGEGGCGGEWLSFLNETVLEIMGEVEVGREITYWEWTGEGWQGGCWTEEFAVEMPAVAGMIKGLTTKGGMMTGGMTMEGMIIGSVTTCWGGRGGCLLMTNTSERKQ